MDATSLHGKVALVTGSSRGVGAGIAAELGRAGATVVVHHRESLERAESVRREIEAGQGRATIVQAELTDERQVDAMFAEIRGRVGPIDILVNNAGTSQPKDIFAITAADWDRILATNLTSAFLCTRRVVDDMRARRWGRILFISSVVARQGALFGHVHYAATKSAMIGFAKTLARTMAPHGVTVNTLGVGMVETELLHRTLSAEELRQATARIPLGRLCQPREVGHLCVFLCGDGAGYITGAMLDINGGLVMDG